MICQALPQGKKKKILEALKYVDEVFISIDEDQSVCESIKAISKKYEGNEIIFTKEEIGFPMKFQKPKYVETWE